MRTEPQTSTGEAESRPAAVSPGEGLTVPFPDLCGDFSMRIDRNGTWYYRGSPIGRLALVKLFSTVLRRDSDGIYWLTTPVENGRIEVEDAPFIGVELIVEGEGRNQIISVRTNLDDIVPLDENHALRVDHDAVSGAPRPYMYVRKGLEARLNRAVFYHLVDLGEAGEAAAGDFGVWSHGRFFALGSTASTAAQP